MEGKSVGVTSGPLLRMAPDLKWDTYFDTNLLSGGFDHWELPAKGEAPEGPPVEVVTALHAAQLILPLVHEESVFDPQVDVWYFFNGTHMLEMTRKSLPGLDAITRMIYQNHAAFDSKRTPPAAKAVLEFLHSNMRDHAYIIHDFRKKQTAAVSNTIAFCNGTTVTVTGTVVPTTIINAGFGIPGEPPANKGELLGLLNRHAAARVIATTNLSEKRFKLVDEILKALYREKKDAAGFPSSTLLSDFLKEVTRRGFTLVGVGLQVGSGHNVMQQRIQACFPTAINMGPKGWANRNITKKVERGFTGIERIE